MRPHFEECTSWLLVHEGGYSDHPRDPGGATNRGITQAVYDAWRRSRGEPAQSVRLINEADVLAIYKRQYWDAVRGDDLPAGLDYAVYDFAVNSGPAKAARALQKLVGVTEDGIIGALTLEAVRKVSDIEALITKICEARLAWMKTLKSWSTFGRGWTRRVMGETIGAQSVDTGVIDRATLLAQGIHAAAPTRTAQGSAREEDVKKINDIINQAKDSKEAISIATGSATALLTTLGALPPWIAALIVVVVAAGVGVWFWKRKG